MKAKVRLPQCVSRMVSLQRGLHYMPLHKQNKQVYIFPNTSNHLFCLPNDYNICTTVDSFKIKLLKGGFQRCPELIAQYGSKLMNNSYKHPNPKTIRIQLELAKMALYLLQKLLIAHPSEQIVDGSKSSKLLRYKFSLDIGCGNGISMIPLARHSHVCIGVDLNEESLNYCQQEEESNVMLYCTNMFESKLSTYKNVHHPGKFDVIRWDLRHGIPFRDNTFDLVISISFLQWLFYGHRSQQLSSFFASLYRVLCPGGKSVIQFYPRTPKQLSDVVNHASMYFSGILVGDYPHTDRGRKLFLLLIKQ